MHDVLAALEAFQRRASDVFERVEDAASRADVRLSTLEGRLQSATKRLEAARGGTKPLVVKSARTLGTATYEEAVRGSERPLGVLKHPYEVCSLPQQVSAAWSPPSAKTAAAELASIVRYVAVGVGPSSAAAGGQAASIDAIPITKPRGNNKLLPPRGRLEGVADLLLFNSAEMPYKAGTRAVDNLAGLLDEEEDIVLPTKQAVDTSADLSRSAWLHLHEDEHDPMREDLRFRPSAAAEVVFDDLPDVLPELEGSVASLVWRQQDQGASETERPAWDAPPMELRNPTRANQVRVATTVPVPIRAPASSGTARQSQQVQQSAAPRPVPASVPQRPPPKMNAEPTAPAPAALAPQLQQAAVKVPPPPPPAAAQGKDKGKGKGKGTAPPPPPPTKDKGKGKGPKPPPPPPSKGASKGKTAPPPPKPKGGGGDMTKVFEGIRSGAAGLKKVGPPKERSAQVGRVLS